MSDKLKPCPFCGEEPFLERYYVQENGTSEDLYNVHCTKCDYDVWQNKQQAIQAWNRRENER